MDGETDRQDEDQWLTDERRDPFPLFYIQKEKLEEDSAWEWESRWGG
jgi:hypothetical protein